jgi:FkbM family methyltransferase
MFSARRIADFPLWIRRRPHEDDYEAFRSFVIESPNVLDVGANRGQAIASLQLVLDDPRIWSFEPNTELASYLNRRFRSDVVQIYPYALSSEETEMTLYIPKYGHTLWDTRASLIEEEARSHLNADVFWGFAAVRASVVEMNVRVRRLDEFGLSPDIIKIDVEGAEGSVVAGGLATIESSLPAILVEGDPEEPEGLLSGLGYARHRYDPVRRVLHRGEVGAINTFLLHPRHIKLFKDVAFAGS